MRGPVAAAVPARPGALSGAFRAEARLRKPQFALPFWREGRGMRLPSPWRRAFGTRDLLNGEGGGRGPGARVGAASRAPRSGGRERGVGDFPSPGQWPETPRVGCVNDFHQEVIHLGSYPSGKQLIRPEGAKPGTNPVEASPSADIHPPLCPPAQRHDQPFNEEQS